MASLSKLSELATLGQSIWYDFIRRDFLINGELQALVDKGLRGLTSNPSIFEKAITKTRDYDEELNSLLKQTGSVHDIYENLVISDIKTAAEIFNPVYEATGGIDGYVSLEVNPLIAHDTQSTIDEAKRLFKKVNKKNLMIKVPATKEGLPAVTELLASGINVNVTLIFSLENYLEVADAYKKGIQKLVENGGDASKVSSVASFFVSRLDSYVDKLLDEKGNTDLKGKTAVSYAKVTYHEFLKTFTGDIWQSRVDHGAHTQRLLWASTSTKNHNYSDTLYVDNLIGPNTVNTVPPATLENFCDHGTVKNTISKGLDEAHDNLQKLEDIGIDLKEVTDRLQKDGVEAFANSYKGIIHSIEEKIGSLNNA